MDRNFYTHVHLVERQPMQTPEVSVVDYRNLFIHSTNPTRKCNPFAKESFKQPYQATQAQEGKFATLNYFNLISKILPIYSL